MKLLSNQRGYALIIVLLVIVLFLGISATFIAGSLNHATQERTIDTSNQAVASAEMGVHFYSEALQLNSDLLKKSILKDIQEGLAIIAACDNCDKAIEKQKLDAIVKKKYTDGIEMKVNQLETDSSLSSRNVSDDGRMNYELESKSFTLGTNKIDIELNILGNAEQGEAQSEKRLAAAYKINIPPTFLKTTSLTYQDVFSPHPVISCSEMITKVINNTAGEPLYECNLDAGDHLSDLVSDIQLEGLDPKLFRAYTDDFVNDICGPIVKIDNCNKKEFSGINVTITSGMTSVKNMNELTNFTLYIEGILDANNMNSLTDSVIVVKELDKGKNIEKMKNSTIAVLGYEGSSPLARFVVERIKTDSNSKVCMNIDNINATDLVNLPGQIVLDATSKVIYYTAGNKSFSLTHNENKGPAVKQTDYAHFLSECGIGARSLQTTPNISDLDLDYTVDYE